MEERVVRALIFDTETNGLSFLDSVLSFSAYLVKFTKVGEDIKVKIEEKIDRYYMPQGEFNPEAIAVNGLYEDKIMKNRGDDCKYPIHFKDDNYILELCERADKFVAHNINFDCRYMPIEISKSDRFCTMLTNTDVVKIVKYKSKTGKLCYKWPKLSECVKHYNIECDESMLHSSLYDVDMTYKLLLKMTESEKLGKQIESFLFSDSDDLVL